MSKYSTWYSWNPVKKEMQTGSFFASSNEFKREYPIGCKFNLLSYTIAVQYIKADISFAWYPFIIL